MPEITFLSNSKEPGRIGSLVLDAVLSDSHEFTNEITDYPIEDGSNINDHIKRVPVSITINGFITNSPIAFLKELDMNLVNSIVEGSVTSLEVTTSNRVSNAFAKLLDILGESGSASVSVAKPKLVEIVTGLKVYQNMGMTKLSISRTPADGESLRFLATFKKITKVFRENVLLPKLSNASGENGTGANIDLQDQAASKKDAGTQAPKKLKSLAKRLGESDLPNKVVETLKNVIGVE